MMNEYFSGSLSLNKCSYLLLFTATIIILSSSFKNSNIVGAAYNEDSLLSKKAFLSVYDVLVSPRCMNCHPSGEVPLVGDESKLHSPAVKRGKDGRGMYASKCANCHMDSNQPD